MRPVLLLGLNFARTQWIAVAVMSAYLLGIAAVFRSHVQHTDLLFFLRWHAGYAVFLAGMMAVPALQMERKTRRILAVLSKGVFRWQYLAGLLCGCMLVAALFCALLGAIILWLCSQGGAPAGGLGSVVIGLFCCCAAAAAAGLFFSTFLHPFLAAVATSVMLSLPAVFEAVGSKPPWELFPVAWLFHFLLKFQLQGAGKEIWAIAAAALVQVAVFWGAAALVFSRRDVTVSPE